MDYKLHPILVNFTAALVPFSLLCDAGALASGDDTLAHSARWSVLFAAAVTPLTAFTGWLFWMKDDQGSAGMAVHKRLGTALPAVLILLALWRAALHKRGLKPRLPYLLFAALVVALLVYQGSLGGAQVFSSM